MSDWCSLEEITDIIECKGCAESFLFPLFKQVFSYQLSESIDRLINTEGLAILMTASILYEINHHAWISFGGNLYQENYSNISAEIDIFWLLGDYFIIAECKSIHRIDKEEKIIKKINQLKNQIDNLVTSIAPKIKAQAIVIGILTDISDKTLLFEEFKNIVNKGKKNNIGVHLIINWELYLWGENISQGINKVSIEDLFVNFPYSDDSYIETLEVSSFSSKVLPIAELPFDSKIMNSWYKEFSK